MIRIALYSVIVCLFFVPERGFAKHSDQIVSSSIGVAPKKSKRAMLQKGAIGTDRKTAKRAHRSRRQRFAQLNDAPGLKVRDPERAWGTPITIQSLQDMGAVYEQSFPDASPVWIHDISKKRGGRFHPHVSHRTGQDVDIRLMLKHETERYMAATPRTLDPARNWLLVKSLLDTGHVEVMFLDRRLQRVLYRYALKQGHSKEELKQLFEIASRERNSPIRHWKGHEDHLHVRFVASPREKTETVVAMVDQCVAHKYQ